MDIGDLYRTHGPSVLRRARRLLGNDDDAREALQDVFASLVTHPAQLQGVLSVTAWLYGVTTNRCLKQIRDHHNRLRLLHERVAPNVTDVPRGDAPSETAHLVHELLAKMPAELGAVAVHYYLDEMTLAEIADVLGCSRRRVADLVGKLEARVTRQVGAP